MGSVIERILVLKKKNIIIGIVLALMLYGGYVGLTTYKTIQAEKEINKVCSGKTTINWELCKDWTIKRLIEAAPPDSELPTEEELKRRYYQHIEETGGWAEYWKTGHWKNNNPSYDKERRQWKEILKWPDHCEKDYLRRLPSMQNKVSGITEYTLDDSKSLLILSCEFMAYQGTNFIYIFDKKTGKAENLSLPYFRNDYGFHLTSSVEVPGFLKFDAKTNILTLFIKSRGTGDCGYSGEYILKFNALFELTRAKAKDCDNSPKRESEWPVIYKNM